MGRNERDLGDEQSGAGKKSRAWIALWVGLGLALIVIGIARWHSLAEPKYFWPRAAEDWAAWGTVVGSGGTIGAVIYAARTFRSSSKAQLDAQRDRQLEMDYLEQKEAEEAKKLKLVVQGIRVDADGEDRSNELSGARVVMKNFSDKPFRDLQVLIPKESLCEGTSISNLKFSRGYWRSEDGLLRAINQWVANEKISWSSFGPSLSSNAELTHIPIGDLHPGQALMIKFDFSGPNAEDETHWIFPPDPFAQDDQRESLVSVSYVDAAGKHWMRSTKDEGRVRRLRYPKFE